VHGARNDIPNSMAASVNAYFIDDSLSFFISEFKADLFNFMEHVEVDFLNFFPNFRLFRLDINEKQS
jgi:hypothetical protein